MYKVIEYRPVGSGYVRIVVHTGHDEQIAIRIADQRFDESGIPQHVTNNNSVILVVDGTLV